MCAFTPEVSGAAHRWPPSLHSGRLIRQRRRLIASDGHDAARGQQLRTGGRPPSERGAHALRLPPTSGRGGPQLSGARSRCVLVRSAPLSSLRSAAAASSRLQRCTAALPAACAPPAAATLHPLFGESYGGSTPRSPQLAQLTCVGAQQTERGDGAASSQRQRQRLASGAGDEWPPHTRMLRRDRRGLCGPGALLKPQLRGRVRFNRRLDAIRAATLFAAGPPAPVRLPALPVQDAPSAQR